MSLKKMKTSKKDMDLTEDLPNLFERGKIWLVEHPYLVLGAMMGVLFLVASYWGITAYKANKERSAGEAYARIMRDWPADDAARSGDMEKVRLELEKMATEHAGTKASLNARLDLARACLEMKRREDALMWAGKAFDEIPPESELKLPARYQLALTYQLLDKVDEAITQWNALKSEGLPGLAREVDWYLGRLYVRKGDGGKAIEHYEAALKGTGFYPSTAQLSQELSQARLGSAASPALPKKEAAGGEPKG